MHLPKQLSQRGAALIVALLLLIVLTLIGLAGMSSGIFGLRMAGNIQSYYDSFQSAEAGLMAAMSQRDALFDGGDRNDVFDSNGSNALKDIIAADVDIEFLGERTCTGGSADKFICEHYLVTSEHTDGTTGARTRVVQRVVRQLLKM